MGYTRGRSGLVLSAQIIRVDALTPSDLERWRHWQLERPDLGSGFFRPEFTLIAGRHCPEAYVAKLHRDGAVVGYFPFQKRGAAIYPIAAPLNDFHGVIGPLAGCPGFEDVAQALGVRRFYASSWVGPVEYPVAHLSATQLVVHEDGFEGWISRGGPRLTKLVKNKRRTRGHMERELGSMVVDLQDNTPSLLDELIALKRSQYKRTGRHDIFAVPWTRALLEALHEHGGEDFGARIASMHAGGQLLALSYTLYSDDRCHLWFPAYTSIGARYGAGMQLRLETVRGESARGVRLFDFGAGGEDFKRYFLTDTMPVAECSWNAGATFPAMALAARVAQRHTATLRTSLRRRWSAIEACEPTHSGRVRGALAAATSALSRRRRR